MIEYYERACDYGNIDSMASLARFYMIDDARTDEDVRIAIEYCEDIIRYYEKAINIDSNDIANLYQIGEIIMDNWCDFSYDYEVEYFTDIAIAAYKMIIDKANVATNT